VPTKPRTHWALSVGRGGFTVGGKEARALSWSPYRTEVNTWSHTFAPLVCLRGMVLKNCRHLHTFYMLCVTHSVFTEWTGDWVWSESPVTAVSRISSVSWRPHQPRRSGKWHLLLGEPCVCTGFLVAKPVIRRVFGSVGRGWNDVRINLNETGWERVYWIHLARLVEGGEGASLRCNDPSVGAGM
jgi:hypothetical protein